MPYLGNTASGTLLQVSHSSTNSTGTTGGSKWRKAKQSMPLVAVAGSAVCGSAELRKPGATGRGCSVVHS